MKTVLILLLGFVIGFGVQKQWDSMLWLGDSLTKLTEECAPNPVHMSMDFEMGKGGWFKWDCFQLVGPYVPTSSSEAVDFPIGPQNYEVEFAWGKLWEQEQPSTWADLNIQNN